MADSKCKKCHKPLVSGNKCDACKQKKLDKIIKPVLAIGATLGMGALGTAAVSTLSKDNDSDDFDDSDE